MTRSKKNVSLENVGIKVCLYVFDILYLNDENLLEKSLKERREIMSKFLTLVPGKLEFVQSKDTEDLDKIQEFLDESVNSNSTSKISGLRRTNGQNSRS